MDDKRLIQEVMTRNAWNQKQVADYLGADKSLITRVLRYDQPLRIAYRKLLLLLLENENIQKEEHIGD